MAVTIGSIPAALADTLVTDNGVVDSAGTQANSGSTTLYAIRADASGASGATAALSVATTSDSYIKIWDATSGAPDSNNPDYVFPVPTGKNIEYVCAEGNALASGLRYWGTSTRANGSTQAATAPAAVVNVKFLLTQEKS